jgi:hypothetical protein
MSTTVPAQHPAVVLRSSYQLARGLLALAVIAILGLTAAVVVLATNNGASTTARPAAHASTQSISASPSVLPNPDQQLSVGPQSIPQVSSASPSVLPNPDQQVSAPQQPNRTLPATTGNYPGHF